MVRLVGFEPTTYGLEVRCSIQLSYRRIVLTIYFLVSYITGAFLGSPKSWDINGYYLAEFASFFNFPHKVD